MSRSKGNRMLARACVVLVRPRGPINIGMACRAMANLGVNELRLVAPICEVNCSDARKFAHHAKEILLKAKTFETLPEAVEDCSHVVATSARRRLRGRMPAWTPAQAAEELGSARRGKLALVFGNELNGLNNDELEACQAAIRLATPGSYPSYNLSHAVAITLYELAAAGEPPIVSRLAPADQSELRRLHAVWLELLEHAGYFRRTTKSRYAPKLARMLARWRITKTDVSTMSGMLAQFERVLRR